MNQAYHPLVRKLEHFVGFSEAERDAIIEATADVRRHGPREDLIREGDRPGAMNVVVSGFACRYKVLPDGRRQVSAFFVPGDFCDYRNFLLHRLDHGLVTLSQGTIALVTPAQLHRLTTRWPRVERALAWAQLMEASITREWLTNIGQRTAIERIAHLFCELFWRLRAVGQTRGSACELPFTQTELADTVGLSAVHVNRTLQELRRAGLITLRERELTIPDLPALESLALFDPGYLHLEARDHGEETAVRERA